MLSLLIIYINSQAFDSRQIGDPLVTYMLGYPFCKKRVTMKQETSLGNTIGLVVEFLRHHLVEILQLSLLQDLSMQFSHTVYRITCHDCQMSHLYLTVHDNGHLLNLLIVVRVLFLDLNDKSAVDLLYDLVDTRKQSGEQLDRPFFQCLSHDGVVGVSTGFSGYIPCLIPLQSFLIHQDTHQLCHCNGRMCII